MCTYSCNRLCKKLDYYSYGHVLVQLIVRRIINMIVHMRILFISCVLDCMNSCTSDCFYEHPRSGPSSLLIKNPVSRECTPKNDASKTIHHFCCLWFSFQVYVTVWEVKLKLARYLGSQAAANSFTLIYTDLQCQEDSQFISLTKAISLGQTLHDSKNYIQQNKAV